MLRRLLLHPVLLAASPVLLLWAFNADEVAPGQALPVLGWVTGVVVALWLLVLAAWRDAHRAALLASAAAVLGCSHGYFFGDLLVPWAALVAVLVVLAATAVWVGRAPERTIGRTTVGANVVAVLLVLGALPGVATSVADAGPVSVPEDVAELVASVDDVPTRDIFYIVPDRYGREDALQETFGIDNGAFTSFLEEHGFEVADEAIGNYPKTAHSLASTLALSYLDDLDDGVPATGRDSWAPVYDMLRDHRLGRVLTAVGYEYVHLGTWWSPTASAASADRVRTYGSRSEFSSVFIDATVVPDARALFDPAAPTSTRDRIRAHSAWQLDELERLARTPGDRPRFVFAHITLPHEPYVFDADGGHVTRDEQRSRTRADNFARQLAYLNGRLEGLVELLAGQPEETAPIVLLQADEGPHPDRLAQVGDDDYRWSEASDADLRTKLRILSAYRLPGVDASALVREDMSAVNSFRLILDTYLGTELGQLDDRAFVFPDDSDLYSFREVTERVRD